MIDITRQRSESNEDGDENSTALNGKMEIKNEKMTLGDQVRHEHNFAQKDIQNLGATQCVLIHFYFRAEDRICLSLLTQSTMCLYSSGKLSVTNVSSNLSYQLAAKMTGILVLFWHI